MTSDYKDYKKYLTFIAIIFALKIIILGIYPFHYPSEARYAAIAMRMELTGNYLMPYFDISTPFFAKPPLSFWASAISFKLFGFSEFTARLPHLLAMLAVCFLLYRCIAKIYDKKTALVSVLILSSCALFYALHSVMTEAFLLLGMTMITLSFWLQIQSTKPKNIDGYLFFLGCIISMLTKGPVGIIMPCLGIFIYLVVSSRWRELFYKFPIFSGTIIFGCLALPWFILAEAKYPGFLDYFFVGENFNRFAKPGWSGDRYGNAHRVPFAAIWYFFISATLPIIFLVLAKPKKTFLAFASELRNKANPAFLFFFISFITPLIVLTFMRNMIMTYAIYALVPFVILLTVIIVEKKWHKFIYFLAYFTIALHSLCVLLFLAAPKFLEERFNQQDYLVKHIPEENLKKENFELYYLGQRGRIFTLDWYSKDKVKTLDEQNFSEISSSTSEEKYIIGDASKYLLLSPQHQQKLNKIICVKKRGACLYKFSN